MRRALRTRAWAYSLAAGTVFGLVALIASFAHRALSIASELDDRNRQTLSRIACDAASPAWVSVDSAPSTPPCDITSIENDLAFEPADYVLDPRNRYFIYNKGYLDGYWLNRSDVSFLRHFHTPESVVFQTGERWRILSMPARLDGRDIEVMVGAFESSPWTMGESSHSADIDSQLMEEARSILLQAKRSSVNSKADAWQIVDVATQNVRRWSGDVPALLPDSELRNPWSFNLQNGQIWLARTAYAGPLVAVSLRAAGSPYGYILFGVVAFGIGCAGAYPLARRIVKTGITRPASLEEALSSGETELVEFKQEVKERQSLLKDVAAFANTRGGTVFIGIIDGSLDVVGIGTDTLEKRDIFERGLRDSIRNSIQPPPSVVIDYESRGSALVARIFVLAGREPHSFEGRYYVREGTQSRYLSDGEIGRL